jgi:hypothetical protein
MYKFNKLAFRAITKFRFQERRSLISLGSDVIWGKQLRNPGVQAQVIGKVFDGK